MELKKFIKRELKEHRYNNYRYGSTFYSVILEYFRNEVENEIDRLLILNLKTVSTEEVLEILNKKVEIDDFKLQVLENCEAEEILHMIEYKDIIKNSYYNDIREDVLNNLEVSYFNKNRTESVNNAINRYIYLYKRNQLRIK